VELFRRGVEQQPVGADGLFDVIRLLEAAFDLQRLDAEFAQLRQQFDGAEILRRKEESVALLAEVAAAARLFAFAPVAAVSAEVRREQTRAGERGAQRAVDEHLEFEFRRLAHRGDLFHGHLPLEHHPADAEFFGDFEPGRVVETHLGRGVELEFREIFARHPDDPEILHQQCVGAHLLQRGQCFGHFRKFLFLDQRVERDIDLAA